MSARFDNDKFLELAKKWPDTVPLYLHTHFYRKLVRLAEKKTNNRQAAEDIVQDVLIEVWRNIKRLVQEDGFLITPYLLMLVRYRSASFYRYSLMTRATDPDQMDSLVSAQPVAEEYLFARDNRRQIRLLIGFLPRRERECIQLRYLDGLSNEAVAYRLGISKKTVEKRLQTGIKFLRERIKRKKGS